MSVNILSLFDGISCGMMALERAGISVTYYASEIDKYAIQTSRALYSDIIRLGNVQHINYQILPKIDLLIGGSPCTGFSFAGKQLNFKDPRSALFFEFVHALKTVKPKNFLFENVKMKKEIQNEISRMLGCEPIEINSALVSGQNRKRLYWTDIPGIVQPKDKGIVLADILEFDVSGSFISTTPSNHQGGNQLNTNYKSQANTIHDAGKKSPTVCAGSHGYANGHIRCGAMRGRYLIDGKRQDGKMKTAGLTTQRMELRKDNKTNTLTTIQKDNYVVVRQLGRGNNVGFEKIMDKCPTITSNSFEHNLKICCAKDKNPEYTENYLQFDPAGKRNKSLGNRVNLPSSKHKALSGTCGGNKHGVVIDKEEYLYRKLTVRECARLQTMPEHIIDKMLNCGVSNSQLYKQIGNGWTIDVITHIFKTII